MVPVVVHRHIHLHQIRRVYGVPLHVVEAVQMQHVHLILVTIVIKCHVTMVAEVLVVEEIVILDVELFVIVLDVTTLVPKGAIVIVRTVV